MSVYKSPRGKWMIEVNMATPHGERVRVRKVSPVQTKAGVTKFELQVRRQILDSTWNKPREAAADVAPTLAEWAETFIRDHSEAKHNRPSTIREQRSVLRNHLIPVLGANIRMDAIRTPQFAKVPSPRSSAGSRRRPRTTCSACSRGWSAATTRPTISTRRGSTSAG